MFLHSKVKDQVIEENYQKILTKKKYDMLSFPPVVFKADKDSVCNRRFVASCGVSGNVYFFGHACKKEIGQKGKAD